MTLLLLLPFLPLLALLPGELRRDGLGHRPPPRSHDR